MGEALKLRELAVRKVLIITLVLNVISATVKILAGHYFHFISLTSSGLESLFDGSANVLALVSIYFASQPPDDEHPFGHHKFETIGSLVIGGLLVFSAIQIGMETYNISKSGSLVRTFHWIPLVSILISMSISMFVAWYEKKKGNELNSNILLADANHTFGDFVISFAVLASILATAVGVVWLDVLVGGIVSVYLAYLAIKILKSNLPDLVDTSPSINKELFKKIEQIPEIVDIHNFRARGNLSYMQVDFHLHLEADLSLREAHKVGKKAEGMVKEALENQAHQIDVTVHIEPYDEDHKK
ncbi:MAG: cation transporter [Bacteriovoracaceae bacterium]|nr:cation transporter [Bacteriovoracaceae bacterium]